MSIKRMLLVVLVSAVMLGLVSLISRPAQALPEETLPRAISIVNLIEKPGFTLPSVEPHFSRAARSVQTTNMVTVPASADVTIDSRYPNTNYNAFNLMVTFSSTGTMYTRSMLIYFDLSTALPPDAILDQADLELYQYAATGANPVIISATQLITAWNEDSVTWATQPARGKVNVAASVNAITGYKSLNVTSVVSTWLKGENYGLILTHLPNQVTSFDRRFYSRETTQYDPRLVIHYHRPSDFCGGTFDVLQDTFVRSDQPTVNMDGAGYVRLRRGADGNSEARAYLKFDSAQLAAAIPPGSNIYQAVLELYLTQIPTPTVYAFETWAVSGAWRENQLTWNTQPSLTVGFGSTLYDVAYTGAPTSVVRVDVTSLATLWAARAITQTGIALLPTTAGMDVFFGANGVSRVGAAMPTFAIPRSRLIVHCTPPVPPSNGLADNRDSRILAGWQRLRAASSATPTIELDHGSVRFANFTLNLPAGISSDGRERAQWFTRAYSDLLSMDDPDNDLQLVGRSADDQHIVFRQRHQGIPVYPAQLVVNMSGNQVRSLSGAYLTEIKVDPQPRLSAEQAEDLALALERMKKPGNQTLAIQSTQAYEFYQPRVAGQTQLRYLNLGLTGALARNAINPQPEPPGLSSDQVTYLTWQVNLHNGLVYYIDAHSGGVRFIRTQRMSDFDLDIDTGNFEGPSDNCWFWDETWGNDDYCDEDGCNGGDLEGNEAYNAIRDAYHFWNGAYNRDSYDAEGTEIDMYIHVGVGWSNAQWINNCGYFEFGDGHGNARDIVGHEYGHAIQNSLPNGGLVYLNDPGAINESMADIFGTITEMYHNDTGTYDPIDWIVGDNLSPYAVGADYCPDASYPGGALRSFYDPPDCGQPGHMADFNYLPTGEGADCTAVTGNDCGYVHTNSGIPNKAFYLMATGESSNGFNMPVAIGPERTLALLYHVLHRISAGAGFVELRNHAVQTARDFADEGMYGFGAQEICTVQNAYAAVGLGSGDRECDGAEDDNDPETLDNDGVPDTWDNCPSVNNSSQANHDTDAMGDACDLNNDNDAWPDSTDNCNNVWQSDQNDWNGDSQGDVCDDSDGDERVDAYDNCRNVANSGWFDWDEDGLGDKCDADDDGDSALDVQDNCHYIPNPNQANSDGDTFGNVCDECPNVYSNDPLENVDIDNDGLGNVCDLDDDRDYVLDDGDASGSPTDKPCGETLKTSCDDNCRRNWNPTQDDWDEDGQGDACDPSQPPAIVDQINHEVLVRNGEALFQILGNPPPYEEGTANAYLSVGYQKVVEVQFQSGLNALFGAKIIDSEGRVVARTRTALANGQYKARLHFTPDPYAVSSPASLAAWSSRVTANQSLAPDEIQYHLVLAPLPGTSINQVYTYTVKTLGYSAQIFLPIMLK